jgi:hypothetical protein
MSWKLRLLLIGACVTIAAGATMVIVKQANAMPPSSYHKEYYDAQGYWIGESNQFCDGSVWNDGAQSGARMEKMTEACSGGSPVGGSRECFVCFPTSTGGDYSCHITGCH